MTGCTRHLSIAGIAALPHGYLSSSSCILQHQSPKLRGLQQSRLLLASTTKNMSGNGPTGGHARTDQQDPLRAAQVPFSQPQVQVFQWYYIRRRSTNPSLGPIPVRRTSHISLLILTPGIIMYSISHKDLACGRHTRKRILCRFRPTSSRYQACLRHPSGTTCPTLP